MCIFLSTSCLDLRSRGPSVIFLNYSCNLSAVILTEHKILRLVIVDKVNVATDRAALSPEAEDERDEGDQASHHPDVAREYRKMMMMFIVSIISIYIGISPEDHHS